MILWYHNDCVAGKYNTFQASKCYLQKKGLHVIKQFFRTTNILISNCLQPGFYPI